MQVLSVEHRAKQMRCLTRHNAVCLCEVCHELGEVFMLRFWLMRTRSYSASIKFNMRIQLLPDLHQDNPLYMSG